MSAQPKWTPGPWDYERELDPGDLPRAWVGRLSEQRFAALSCGESRAEADANARLIAAAPDMFEALVQTRALVVACCDSGFTDDEAVTALYRNNGAISAALAKASSDDSRLTLNGRDVT